jgi:hypothetical protein
MNNVYDKIIQNAIDKFSTCMIGYAENKRLKEWITNGLLNSVHHKQ